MVTSAVRGKTSFAVNETQRQCLNLGDIVGKSSMSKDRIGYVYIYKCLYIFLYCIYIYIHQYYLGLSENKVPHKSSA